MFEVLNQSDQDLLKDCTVETFRSSGPGGQKADRTESAVRITHLPSGVQASAQESRSQHENKRRALRRLRRRYALKVRHALEPDRLGIPPSLRDAFDRGLRIRSGNPRYPFVVKLVLDVFHAEEARVGPTADRLGLSTNRLVQFFQSTSDLWQRVNRMRAEHGHHRLR